MASPLRTRLRTGRDTAVGLAGIGAVVAIWCAATYGGYVKPIFLPTPSAIWDALVGFQQHDWLLPAVGSSLWRILQSLFLVVTIGIPIGLAMGAFPFVDSLLRKLVNAGKSVPTTGLVGLIVLWFSIEERAKIVFLFLGAIFYMIILVRNAIGSVNEDYIRVALDLGATRRQVILRVLLPGALPQIWQALAVCNGIMWTYIVLAEFINSSQEQLGVGYLLYIGSRTQNAGQVFATLILIALISAITDWGLVRIRRRFLPW